MSAQRVTHYAPWDAPGPPHGSARALCGVWIRKRESVGEPTCPRCAEILAQRDADEV